MSKTYVSNWVCGVDINQWLNPVEIAKCVASENAREDKIRMEREKEHEAWSRTTFDEAIYSEDKVRIEQILATKEFNPNGVDADGVSYFAHIIYAIENTSSDDWEDYSIELIGKLKKMGGTNTEEALEFVNENRSYCAESEESLPQYPRYYADKVEMYDRIIKALD